MGVMVSVGVVVMVLVGAAGSEMLALHSHPDQQPPE